jgi:DHA1 family bicyclomycin/chloramphenicol resistance-like MFS transporter
VNIGFAVCGLAAAVNIAYGALAPQLVVPWAVMPIALTSFGVALVFPVLTLAILDMYPHQRGSASSLQAFTSLVINALLAGVLSPLVSHSGLLLAVVGAGFTFAGWVFWQWEKRHARVIPEAPCEGAIGEPSDHV